MIVQGHIPKKLLGERYVYVSATCTGRGKGHIAAGHVVLLLPGQDWTITHI